MQEQITVLTDDLDGRIATHRVSRSAVETITFALDGVSYVIDLGTANATKLRAVFAGYIPAARVVTVKAAPRAGRKAARTRQGPPVDIRQWGRDHGFGDVIKDRGRVPARVVHAYQEATARAS